MSNLVTAPLWKRTDMPSTVKFVAISLGDQANDEGYCWPSVGSLARRTMQNERTVQRALRELEETYQLIEVVVRPGRSNGYQFRLDKLQGDLFELGGGTESPPADSHPRQDTAPAQRRGRGGPVPGEGRHTATHNRNRTIKEPSSGDTPAGGHRDELFEVIAQACRWPLDQLTKSSRGRINRAAKELREIGATPDQVRDRAERYRKRFPDCAITPQALTGNWGLLADLGRPPAPQETEDERLKRERQERVSHAESLCRLLRDPVDLKRQSYESLEAWCGRVEQAWDEHTRATA